MSKSKWQFSIFNSSVKNEETELIACKKCGSLIYDYDLVSDCPKCGEQIPEYH